MKVFTLLLSYWRICLYKMLMNKSFHDVGYNAFMMKHCCVTLVCFICVLTNFYAGKAQPRNIGTYSLFTDSQCCCFIKLIHRSPKLRDNLHARNFLAICQHGVIDRLIARKLSRKFGLRIVDTHFVNLFILSHLDSLKKLIITQITTDNMPLCGKLHTRILKYKLKKVEDRKTGNSALFWHFLREIL